MGKWQRNYYTDETGHKHIDIVNMEQEAPAYVNPFVKTNLRLMKWVIYIVFGGLSIAALFMGSWIPLLMFLGIMYIGHVPKN